MADSRDNNTEDYGGSERESKGSQSGQNEHTGDIKKGDGGQFGEVGDTGVGTDLTMTMENTDPSSGLIKGGQPGEDDIAGPAQYGGEAGDLGSNKGGGSASRTEGMRSSTGSGGSESHGHYGGDGPNVAERPTHSEG